MGTLSELSAEKPSFSCQSKEVEHPCGKLNPKVFWQSTASETFLELSGSKFREFKSMQFEVSSRELTMLPTLTHLLLLLDNLPVSIVVLESPLEKCDQGKGGKPAPEDIGLEKRMSFMLLEEEALDMSSRRASRSLAGGRASFLRTSSG